MDNKKLKLLIESNVRSIIKEEKRKILLEKKVNKLLTERKQLSEKAVLLENNYKINQRKLAKLNEAIQMNENFLSKIGRAFKGLFGGLKTDDLEQMSNEKEQKAIAQKEQYAQKKLNIIYDLIDKLEDKIRNKFAPDIERIPTVKEIEDFSKETRNLYTTLIDFFPELKGKTITDLLKPLSNKENEEYDKIVGSGKGSSSIPGKFLTDMGKLKRSVLSIIRSVQDALEGHAAKLEAKQEQTKKDYSNIIRELELKNNSLKNLLQLNGEALLSGKLPVEPIGYGTPGWAKAAAAFRKAPRRTGDGPKMAETEREPSATAVSNQAVKNTEEALNDLKAGVGNVIATVMQAAPAAPAEDRKEIVKVMRTIPIEDVSKVQTMPPPKKIGLEQGIKDARRELDKLTGKYGNVTNQISNMESDLEQIRGQLGDSNIKNREQLRTSLLIKGMKLTNLQDEIKEIGRSMELLRNLLQTLTESIKRKNKKIV